MKLSMIVNPFTERNLQLATQVGVEEIVLTYPGPGLEPLVAARRMVEAAACGVKLPIHPDDPPLPEFNGQPQIITSNEALRRVVDLAPSPSNGIFYCVGSLHPAGVDVVAGIRELAPHIVFVHARNVRGTARHFTETWQDNGEIDMPAVFRAPKEGGYTGSVRPDHAPSMAGETNETPGYEMLGRLFAAGYLRGLMQAA